MEDLPYRPCVGVMLQNKEGRVFVGQRIDNPGPAWQMPQGGIDEGETVMEAALRELWEETGVTADLVRPIATSEGEYLYDLPAELVGKMWGGKFRGQRQFWVLFAFEGEDAQVQIDSEHPEFSQWKWSPVDELVANIVPFKRDVYARVIAEFAPHL